MLSLTTWNSKDNSNIIPFYTYSRIPSKHSFSHEIRKVQGIADVGHPAEEVGQTDHAEGGRHHHDGSEVVLQAEVTVAILRDYRACHL